MTTNLAPLFHSLSHGVYVVGVAAGSRCNAFTAAWVMQVSFDPPLLALSINPAHSSCGLLREGKGFTVNVLAQGQEALARHFGQPASVDKLAGIPWHPSAHGAPLLNDAPAWFECRLVSEYPAGDHLIALGQVVDGQLINPAATPLSYRQCAHMDASAALFPATFTRP